MASIIRAVPFITPFISRLSGNASRTRILAPSISAALFSSPAAPPCSSDPILDPVPNTPLQWVRRTARCGELSLGHVGGRVRLCGWVALHRIHGGLTFINLRDSSGIVQVTTLPEEFPDAYTTANKLKLESVVAVDGLVRCRPSESLNKAMKTGAVEVVAEQIILLNSVNSSLPFPVTIANNADHVITEEVRLRYRFLDLRREKMQCNLKIRHNVLKLTRRYLEDKHDFIEIETPILSKSTPEGARDYLVPSRVQPGTFYALPQSPQLFKQMLMVAGFERYYQIARCFRDEDLRADRQPEFTQLDLEVAFTPLEDILRLNEELIRHIFQEIIGVQLPNPFPRITYVEAMSRYGTDRPDLRFNLELKDVSEIFAGCSFRIFMETLVNGGIIKALRVPLGAQTFSNTDIKKGDIFKEAINAGAKGLPFLKVLSNGELEGVPALTSCLEHSRKERLLKCCAAKADDLILFAVGDNKVVNKVLDRLRIYTAHVMGLINNSSHSILWVTDFPMFKWNASEERFEALHHPFTAPNPEDTHDLRSARALAYDMVYNGVEVGEA